MRDVGANSWIVSSVPIGLAKHRATLLAEGLIASQDGTAPKRLLLIKTSR